MLQPQTAQAGAGPVPADELHTILASLEDAKAEDVVTIDIAGKSALGDHMVVASGRSHRHVGAIADRVIQDLKARGENVPRVEGLPHCDWVLIDTGDVIVHVFRPEVRDFYNIEKMWSAEPYSERRANS
ncbi:ribosome silencing factor [Afifella pfennigii]|uniref:ribosome silencing factor n=1 Tax=Afifella pfennigii TaxID=209897 RepID=UPI000A01435F|nr:ribosome silencing factor [Afifella pfennigii]